MKRPHSLLSLQVSRSALFSAEECAAIVTEAEALNVWDSSGRSAYYAQVAAAEESESQLELEFELGLD